MVAPLIYVRNTMYASDFDTLVIGAGQAGLAVGYHLARLGRDFVILDGGSRVGESWRKRWDSLRLFTPAAYSSLPGLPFPAEPCYLPTKDDVADYLEAYARRFALPIRFGMPVRRVRKDETAFLVFTDDQLFTARNVVVATGAFATPRLPAFAAGLDPAITQLHSNTYRNPDQLPPGPVLVVGAGNSGAQIALELAASREVWLAGPDVGNLPRRILGKDLYWWIWRPVLDVPVDTWRGRRLKANRFAGADPLIGIDLKKMAPPRLHRVGRVVGVSDGKPLLDDGAVPDVASVVWCTGFRPDFQWIEPDVTGEDGYPRYERGVVTEVPGLYFVGLRFQYRMNSSLLGGVGADAAYVAAHIARKPAQAARPVSYAAVCE